MGVAVVRARMLKRVVRMAVVVRMVGEGWLVFRLGWYGIR
jgi:hypothetical protein